MQCLRVKKKTNSNVDPIAGVNEEYIKDSSTNYAMKAYIVNGTLMRFLKDRLYELITQ